MEETYSNEHDPGFESPLEESAQADAIQRIKNDPRQRAIMDLENEELYSLRTVAIAKASMKRNAKMRRKLKRELKAEYKQPIERSFVPDLEIQSAPVHKIVVLMLAIAPIAVASIIPGRINLKPAEASQIEAQEVTEEIKEETVQEEIIVSPIEQSVSLETALNTFTSFTSQNAPHLTKCAEQMVDHTRWVEALAISKQETSYGLKGVGRFNNLGGIKSGKTDRTWRQYATKCDGLEDIAFLIERWDYSKKTIDQMNGRYCVGAGVGGTCIGWNTHIMEVVTEIRAMLN